MDGFSKLSPGLKVETSFPAGLQLGPPPAGLAPLGGRPSWKVDGGEAAIRPPLLSCSYLGLDIAQTTLGCCGVVVTLGP